MSTVQFDIPKELAEFLEVAAGTINECDVSISQSSLAFRAMDPSHIAMIDLAIREESVEPATPVQTRIVLGMLAKALKAGLTHLSYDTETQKITLNGGARKYTIPTLHISSEEVPQPKIEGWEVEGLKLNLTDLKAGASLASAQYARFVGDGKSVVGILNGELTTYEASVATYEGKPFRATFNFDYLKEIVDMTATKLGASQKWSFKTAYPLYATFTKTLSEQVSKDLTRHRTATLQYWLAPRIDQEDAEARQEEKAEAPQEAPAEVPTVEATVSV